MDRLGSVLEVVQQVGGLAQLDPDQDFYDAGMASVQALPLLLELESKFSVTLPDDGFTQARTPRALLDLIAAAQGS